MRQVSAVARAHPGGAGKCFAAGRAFACAFACLTSAAPHAESQAEGPRLIEFAQAAAVFEVGGELVRAAVGEQIPGTQATLRHIGREDVEVEFFADATAVGGVWVIERGQLVPTSVPAEVSQVELLPHIQQIDVQDLRRGEAKQAPASRSADESPPPSP
ncbi:MAG: hypothetical protein ACT4NL_10475 [Pseudomarimonas sp.]